MFDEQEDHDSIIATGEDAKRLLANPAYRLAMGAMKAHIEERELGCPSYNKELAADVVRCKQLLAAFEREFQRMIEDAQDAHHAKMQAHLKELKTKTVDKAVQRFTRY